MKNKSCYFSKTQKSALQSICSTGQRSAYSTVFCFKLGNSPFKAGNPFLQRKILIAAPQLHSFYSYGAIINCFLGKFVYNYLVSVDPGIMGTVWKGNQVKHMKYGPKLVLDTYMILGGIPYYLDMLDNKKPFSINIDNLFFAENAPLKTEFEFLFRPGDAGRTDALRIL